MKRCVVVMSLATGLAFSAGWKAAQEAMPGSAARDSATTNPASSLAPTTTPTPPTTLPTTQAVPPTTMPFEPRPPQTRPSGGGRGFLGRFIPTNPEITKRAPTLLTTLTPVVDMAHHSVGVVFCDGKEVALATVVRQDGYLVTKGTELSNPEAITVKLSSGVTLPARLIGTSFPNDLALLKVEAANLTPVVWSNPSSIRVGQIVVAPGEGKTPLGMGVISVNRRPMSQGFLGVTFSTESDEPKILTVQPNMPAARGGIRAGDVIVRINDQPFTTTSEVRDFLVKQTAGTEAIITVRRDDEVLALKVILAARPNIQSDRSQRQNTMGGQLSIRANDFPAVIQHDTVLQPGQQGGPIVNLDGEAIGVNIARAGRVETYCIPGEVVAAILPDLIAGKYPATTQPSELISAVPDPSELDDTALARRIRMLDDRLQSGLAPTPRTPYSEAERPLDELREELQNLRREKVRRDEEAEKKRLAEEKKAEALKRAPEIEKRLRERRQAELENAPSTQRSTPKPSTPPQP